jgi:hypothetical protein
MMSASAESGSNLAGGRPAWSMLAVVAAALVVRGTLLWLRGDYLDYDESMYLLLGRSILAGDGLSLNAAPHTALGPMLPLASAAIGRFLGNDLLLAQRLLSTIAGTLLLVPVWILVRAKAGERIAAITVALLVAWPALVDVAPKYGPMWTHTYAGSEPLYLCFLFTALACGEAAIERRGWAGGGLAFLGGSALALAYLTRGEAALFGGLYLVFRCWQLLREREAVLPALKVAALSGAAFLIVAAPYLRHLHASSGKWMISGQPDVMFPMAETLQEVFRNEIYNGRYVLPWMSLDEAHAHLLNPYWGTPEGVDRNTQIGHYAWIAAAETPVQRTWSERLVNRLQNYGLMLWTLCGPLLAPFVLIGVVMARRVPIPVFAVAGLAASLLTGFYLVVLPRFFLYLVPAFAFWAAHGVEALATRFTRSPAVATRFAVLLLVAASLASVGDRAQGPEAMRLKIVAEEDRRVAEDLAAALPDVERFMHWHPRIAYWAGWEWRPLPVSTLDAIAHYCSRIGVEHFLLASVGHSPIRLKVSHVVISIDRELRDALRNIAPRTGGAHEHPPMVLSEAPKVGGFSAGTLSLQEPLE